MSDYLVSICVPVYGVERFIERCARSLFEQTYRNIEYIFVNDCTKDNSIAVLNMVMEQYPDRKGCVRVVNHEQNRGLAAARNTAVAMATGDFLMHVDSDDYLEINAVEACVAEQAKTNADIVSFGCYREYPHKVVVQNPPRFKDANDMCLQLITKRNKDGVINVGVWGRMYRQSLYTAHGIKAEEGINMAEDYQVVAKLAYYAKTVAVIRTPLIHYNLQNQNSYVNSISAAKLDQTYASYQLVEQFFCDKGEEYGKALNTAKAYLLVRMLIDAIKGGLGKDYFEKVKSYRDEMPHSALAIIPLPYRLIMKYPYYSLIKAYLKVIILLKR